MKKFYSIFALCTALMFSVAAVSQTPQQVLQQQQTTSAMIRLQKLQEKIGAAKTDAQRLELQRDMVRLLRLLRSDQDAIETYESILQDEALDDPAERYQWVIEYGDYLRRMGRPQKAAGVYRRYLSFLESESESARPEKSSIFEENIQLRLLEVMMEAGSYLSARDLAYEVMSATGKEPSYSLLKSMVGLAESDLVTGEELFQLEDRLLENPAGGELLVRFMRFYVNQDYSSHAVSIGDKLLRQSPEAFLNSLAGIQQSYKADLGEEATAHILQVLEEARKESPENKTTYDLIQVRWLDLAGQSGRALEYLGTLNAGSEVFLKERATLLFSMGRYDEAAEAYESLIVVSPQNITYYRQLGECLYRQDQTEKAMEVWERIPRIQSENPASYITLSEIYRLRGMTTPAAEALKKARELSGADAYEIDRRIMDLWAEEGNMPRLVQEFIHASQARKNREALYRYRLSEQFQEEQKATELLKEISRRLDSNPKFAVRTILLRLGTDILMASGQYDRAIGFVRTGYRGNPELALRLYQLGLDLLHRGAPEKTLVAWSYLPPQSPYYSHSQLQIAQLGLQAGELEKAEEAATTLVEDLIEKSPGKHLYTAGQPLSATGLRKHLTLLRGGNRQRMEDTLLILARIQLEKKKPGDALKWLLPLKKGGTVRAQSQPEVDLLLGHTYSQLGSLETAEEYYRRAREGYQGVPDKRGEAEYALAETLLWQERIPEALDTYLDLAKKDASLPQANESLRRYQVVSQSGAEQLYHYSLAGLFAWKGDREEAVRLYREAAADDAESDQAGWCLFEAAKILAADSQTDAAVKQIEYVLDRYENPTLLAECRTFLTSLDTAEAAEATVADGTNPYEQLILDFPSSIYSELARLKIEGRLEEPF